MKSILKYILLNAVRDRLYLGLLISLLIAFSLSIFLASTALVEEAQMTAAYIAGLSRGILSLGMILFVCLNINRAFENKEVEFILSKSISREKFILSYFLGFFIACFLIFLPLILAITILTQADKIGLLIWCFTLLAELSIVISFAVLASLIVKNSFSSILASIGFYLISRLMGMFVMAINLPAKTSEVNLEFSAKSFSLLLKILSAIFPRLDLFAQSTWLNYGVKDFSDIKIIILQFFIYLPLMIFMSFHDFKKKQF
jgi:ABC-type transport system involved in multi-copper enzyme maturation permease subunit